MTNSTPNSYKGHRFPAEIISHCVWLYYTFPLSYRDIEKMMLERGIFVTYEAIRKWFYNEPDERACAALLPGSLITPRNIFHTGTEKT